MDTATKRLSKRIKVTVGVIIMCVVAVVTVFIIINLSASPAEKTVKAFMKAFKEDNYHEMRQQCNLYAFDDEEFGIFSYSGTNIIDYKIKSVAGPYKVKERLIAKKYDDKELFQDKKEFNQKLAQRKSDKYGIEYIVVEDSNDYYILESSEEILDEYEVTLDVEYSTILGNTKRNIVKITVCQSQADSSEYEITDIFGIIH